MKSLQHPGDENCRDNTYPITVEFTLNDPAIYTSSPDHILGVYGSDYTVMVDNALVPITVTNGVTKGSVVIPAGQSYVDVIIKALDDSDDDEELMCLNVTKAYSAEGLLVNEPFQIGNTGGEAVIIKDAGWAVKSVVWQKNATGNDLFQTWTGLSVYPDKGESGKKRQKK